MNLPEGIDINRVQYIAIAVSILLFSFILWLIRSKKIKEEYSLLWIFFSLVFVVFSLWRGALETFAFQLGIAYPPAALFLILLMAIFLILIQFSIIISKLADNNKTLAQEIALLKFEIEQLYSKKAESQE